ncbi:hypothetical protein GCM10010988_20610 [Cnuibacter physcomitrellae]|uniref:Uncharacterized protein n=1 Tax=Cnuibacter physcomitrellae TaxID=1619308 RepID=A0A1X9LQN5_9MICO|nr:hypothetical protein [Cnuibacter physcomitrellae]ARJ06752.1 hypothetical protein B5808_17125 [Cnuibacter physcomitrellae]GGI38754.1 hypothetical protein GCM10010988_20610 [Cnuibacter physcomitrellae]
MARLDATRQRASAGRRAESMAAVLAGDAAATSGLFVLAGAAALRGRPSRARVLATLGAAIAPSVLLAASAVGAVAAGGGRGSRRAAARYGVAAVVVGDVLHTAASAAFLRRGSGIRGWARLSLVAGNAATALYLRQLLPEARRAR